ncbi:MULTISPECIES: hypothetical protein [unclassified Rhizobium]|uniref:hypothetical protein n=1 Tax=unclassified Rhizobium TaxID=2613769 RepID=UPI0006F7E688|nr:MULTISPECIES: hypothetical protein [unclassified Rhizobium]KQV38005.1 hypothetical protein ASC86_07085 [Rhizobium sp. Root1212]KRD30663.1 hypothetical protein ASE37_07080 [Rhizobium sp. Root268]
MQVPRISLNDDTANNHVKTAKNEIDVIGNLQLSHPHRCSALADFEDEAANDLRLAHPFPGEEKIAEEGDAAAVPFTTEVVGFDATEIRRSLCGLHRLTSTLAEISFPFAEAKNTAVNASIRAVGP